MNAKHHEPEPDATTVEAAVESAPVDDAPPHPKAARKADAALRRRMERLEKRVGKASDREQKRLKQLDRARARRQRLEGELAQAASAAVASTGPGEVETPQQAGTADGQNDSTGAAQLAYCLREHRKVEMQSPVPVVLSNGRSALAATCPSCGATVYKILGRAGTIVAPAQ